MTDPVNVHGTAVLLDGRGVLLRGPSGAGKSLLALALLEHWEMRSLASALVADDRVILDHAGSHLVLRVPHALAGLVELRGRGIIRRAHVAAARLDLVVDLVPDLIRMPEPEAFSVEILGITLCRAPVPMAGVVQLGHQVLLVAEALRALPA